MKRKNRKLRSIVTFILVLLWSVASLVVSACADEGGYRITDYDITAQVHSNNSYSVQETITVFFSEPRHGIYRNIDLDTYFRPTDEANQGRYVEWYSKISDIQVSGSAFSKEVDRSGAVIKMGSADQTVTGAVTYKISYLYSFPDDAIDEYDLVYYSVLGSDWGVPVDALHFSLTFDEGLPKDARNNLVVYSGPAGETGNVLNVSAQVSSDTISGEVTDIPGENAVTLLLQLPEGYFTGESAVSSVPMYIFGGIFLLILLLCALRVAQVQLKPRDPEELPRDCTMAPENICSAEIGMIIDEVADDRDLYSLIPWWANQGFLQMVELSSYGTAVIQLEKLSNLPSNAPEYQRILFHALFRHGKTVRLDELDEGFAEEFGKAKKALGNCFTGKRALSTGSGEDLLWLIGICLSYFAFLSFTSRAALGDNWIIALFVAIPLAVAGLVYQFTLASITKKKIGTYIGRFIIYGLLGMVAVVNIAFLTDDCALGDGRLLASFALAVSGCFLAAKVYRPTEYKLGMVKKLRAFQNFLEHAEMPRLQEAMAADPDYYYQMLPYAMVFGLEKRWTARFRDLTVEPPAWYYYPGYNYYDNGPGMPPNHYGGYHGSGSFHTAEGGRGEQYVSSGSSHSHGSSGSSNPWAHGAADHSSHSHGPTGTAFDLNHFVSSMNTGVNGAISSAITPASSDSDSGSFGGGSSGGGGGGGGGSW